MILIKINQTSYLKENINCQCSSSSFFFFFFTLHHAGVDSLEIDMDKQKVTVKGYVDQRKVLKVVRRTGRRAEFWPFPYDSEYYPYASQYLDETTYTTSYNYYRHGFNESVHGYFPDQAYCTVPDDTVHLFSDDNVHAYCSIM